MQPTDLSDSPKKIKKSLQTPHQKIVHLWS